MNRLSILILVFAVLFAVFFIGPPLMSGQLGCYPLMKVGDVFDIFTPLVLLPLYWLLFQRGNRQPGLSEIMAFVVLAALWAAAHGMHLPANSMSHLVKGMEGSDIYRLTDFYDEVLSHYLWHAGIAGLSALIIYRQWRYGADEEVMKFWVVICAAIIHGFTFFVIVIEAATAPLGITYAVLAIVFCAIWGRKKLAQQPVLTFFLASYAVAVVLFIGWGIYHQGLPEFSELGII
jgi:hypothetical protein